MNNSIDYTMTPLGGWASQMLNNKYVTKGTEKPNKFLEQVFDIMCYVV